MKLTIKSVERDNNNKIISYTLSNGKTISVSEYENMVKNRIIYQNRNCINSFICNSYFYLTNVFFIIGDNSIILFFKNKDNVIYNVCNTLLKYFMYCVK